MKLIEAKYEDVCLTCTKKIKPGDLIYWERKLAFHATCKAGVIGKWLRG